MKYSLVSALSLSILAIVTNSNADSSVPESKIHFNQNTNDFTLIVDSPSVDTSKLQYPIHNNGFYEPVYQSNHPLELNGSENIKNNTIYDPKTNQFLFEQKIGNQSFRPTTYMTDEEYQDYIFKQQVKK